MSATGLFTIGFFVALIVAAAMALLVYAAILDGRDAAARRTAEQDPATRSAAGNVVETARSAGQLTTLLTAIDGAGFARQLADGGPYTIFAPADSAFERLPDGVIDALLAAPETLADVVGYHVVPGRLTKSDVAMRARAETLQGEDLAISSNGEIRVDGARVVQGDIEASNGVIHVIDRMLLPARS